MIDRLLYAVLPYAALALLAGVPLVRWLATPARRASLPAARQSTRHLYAGTRAWRWGLGLLAAVHAVALALPAQAPRGAFAALAAAGFLGGMAALAGLAGLLHGRALAARRVQREGLPAGGPAGNLLLTLTALGLTSGLTMAFAYGWGSSWYTVTLVPYLGSLVRLAPDATLGADLPPLARLHLLSGFALLAALPFTLLGAWPASALATAAAAAARRLRPRAEEPEEDLDETAIMASTGHPGAGAP